MRRQDLQNPQNQQRRTKVISRHTLMGRGRQHTSFTCCSDTVTSRDAPCSDQMKKVKGKSVQKQCSLSNSASTITKGSKATRWTTNTTSLEGHGHWPVLNHSQAPDNRLKLFLEAEFWRLVLKCQSLTFLFVPFFFFFLNTVKSLWTSTYNHHIEKKFVPKHTSPHPQKWWELL